MAIDRTRRSNPFVGTSNAQLGPGAYQTTQVDRSINNPTIGRSAHMFRTAKPIRKRIKNRGSIRADFEEGDESSDEEPQPGPG